MTGPFSGLRAWLVQRVSAVYLLCFILFLVARTASSSWSYASWHDFALAPGMQVGLLLFFAALLVHAWVGLRDVILDYVGPPVVRAIVLGAVAIAEAAIAAWVLVILLRA
jgi:succinate dehydrogenase / fumarate reductase membrane anchor subunit